MTKRLRDFLVVAAVALSAWELLVRVTGVPPYILPGPLRVASAAIEYAELIGEHTFCLLYTSPSPRDLSTSRMPSSA